jgi:hypothetical protein
LKIIERKKIVKNPKEDLYKISFLERSSYFFLKRSQLK